MNEALAKSCAEAYGQSGDTVVNPSTKQREVSTDKYMRRMGMVRIGKKWYSESSDPMRFMER